MAFRVELSDRAQTDVAAVYDWLHSKQVGNAGERWFVAFREAIDSLSDLPLRCPAVYDRHDGTRSATLTGVGV